MRDRHSSPVRERWEGEYDDVKENSIEKLRDSPKHRSKDRSRSSRSEEKDHRSRDRERSKGGDVLSREKEGKDSEIDRTARKEGDRDDRDKDRSKDKKREKERDSDKHKDKEREVKDRKGRVRERDHDGEGELEKDYERSREKGKGKEKSRDRDKDRENERDRTKGREMDKEKEKYTDRYREKETERYRDKDVTEKVKGNERTREKAREAGQDKERSKDQKVGQKHREKGFNRSDEVGRDDREDFVRADGHEKEPKQLGNGSPHHEDETSSGKHQQDDGISSESHKARDLELRISRMREERLQKSEGASEILSWVSKSRKIGEKRMSEKVKKLSRSFEEQDGINQEGRGDDEAVGQHGAGELSGLKVLHGLDKVIEGGAVVLTLKDQSILADGDINQEIDMLENVEIGEQKRRDEAYKAAKKKNEVYDDKFNNELNTERKMLPQYDDPVGDEGVTLDASGGFSGDAEKKLDELRKRINGVSANDRFENLNSLGAITSDYYTHEEMLQFKKPKKKKSLRKKDKLDIDALEAEAISTGLGTGDLGSRNEGKRQAMKMEQEKSEAEMRSKAYKAAYAKAEQASKSLRQLDQTLTMKKEDDDNPVFDDDDDDLRKSLAKARKLAFKNRDEAGPSGPKAIALLAASTANNSTADDQNPPPGEVQENKVVFTEMEEFVWGLQLDNDAHKTDGEDVFMEEDVAPEAVGQEIEENGGWTEVKDNEEEPAASEDKDKVVPDETIHEVAVGKGLSGALKLLKDRGSLKETVEWGGRNMDKKKSKLVGIYDNDGQNAQREIRIERTDEYGRILTPKEAFRLLSHKFHGKGPGKMKQEKRMRQYQEDMKVKQMKNSDTPSQSVERMREAQAQLKTPYLVLSGNVKPGQTSDPRSGFATVENFPGGLTPMLGDRKVEHFLGIKRKAEPGDMGPPPPKQKK